MRKTEVKKNRKNIKWSRWELIYRFLWSFAYISFRFSPRIFWVYRVFLLRCFGAKIGMNVHIYPSVHIILPKNLSLGDFCAIGAGVQLYALGNISIGNRVTISQGAHICAGTHDYRDPEFRLIKSSIRIADDVWIAADAFVGPSSMIGEFSIIGARSVLFGEAEPRSIYVGNPARKIGER